MASIRRTLSPVPRSGGLSNGEACQVASPLSKSSSNSQNYPSHGCILPSSLGALDYALYKAQSFILGLFSHRSSRSFDRPKLKGQIWRRAFLHFIMCFIIGVLVGLTPFIPMNLATNLIPKHQTFSFEWLQNANDERLSEQENEMSVISRLSLNESSVLVSGSWSVDLKDAIANDSEAMASDLVYNKLLIIVTPTHAQPLQAYYLHRLAYTLKLVPHPLLWIVVEMNSQSAETAEILRNTGVVYRHLVCSIKNSTEVTDKNVLLRNVALSHIETHQLDGIVYFADDDKIYTTDLFDHMRNISRIGTWTVAKLLGSEGKLLFEGPICNGSQVVGWHVPDISKRFRRFHAEMSGFAFNSTIIWDPKRWHRPTIEPIRQVHTVKQDLQASMFVQLLVEDESQMECFSAMSPGIMVWHHTTDEHHWFTSDRFATVVPLSEIR
ncbi:probable beta-1,4-xylosyltransferase IRX9H [Andrographis paniculata]|uniref:probable beta-1,4-xylosyltransferase IRX9H n=1 Tax=Andrographis paniculata TaxID=175694 RepID=UPI0021E96155|nr:probable beta-1,4-xylosyltransferase IRX9H [Andrographis paniculata]XP_051151612.1 probable beta-1,4-xylosyltransferase IRX9H [Andrographis paniculata]XP_051151613.1 probable beta-1,4-xylosyltransferase IRX9H [Andrographis paniculata]